MSQKIPVAVLGATGSVGQRFIQLLENHPWFEVKEVAASERSAGKPYKEAVNWVQSTPIPESVKNLTVKNCEPGLESKVTFSGLDSSIAGEVETAFASKGYAVISNSKNHRMDKDVPLLVPEINPDHLQLVKYQKYNGGLIVTNPNCSTIGMVRSEEHTSELQSQSNLVCRLLLEKKKHMRERFCAIDVGTTGSSSI